MVLVGLMIGFAASASLCSNWVTHGSAASPTAVSIISFTATPTVITLGQSATLTPVFGNATSAFILDASYNPIDVVSGTGYAMTPSSTTTYELVVDGAGGERQTRTVTVNVNNGLTQFRQQGPKLVATDALGNASQGRSVSISADGNTAIVGASNDNNGAGAAWVWTRSGGVWTQGAKLVGSGAVMSTFGSGQGTGVAISADGNTAMVGGWNDTGTWVFTRSGNVWTQQGSKLVPSGVPGFGFAGQGSSVALSADGNTAIIGGPLNNAFSHGDSGAWVWTRSGGIWTQQGSILVGSGSVGDARQGSSVSISADGNTAIVGGYLDNFSNGSAVGAAWVWTRSGGVWTQQGPKLVTAGAFSQGISASLSADGNTAIVGATGDSVQTPGGGGAARVWTRSGGVWSQGPRLVGPGDASSATLQGFSVSLSANGNTALIGGVSGFSQTSTALVWTRSGGVWTHQGTKLVGSGAVGSGNGQQPGVSVSLSGDGSAAIVGGWNDNSGAGAAWIFASTPTPNSCGDERDGIIQEYKDYIVNLSPVCANFTQTARSQYFSFSELNKGDYSWALIRSPLTVPASSGYGLDMWRQEYGASRIINSAYRNPKHNASQTPKGATNSRHMYGDAVDLRNETRTLEEWNRMFNAAKRARADWTEPQNGPCGLGCFHADWRKHGSSSFAQTARIGATQTILTPSDEITNLLAQLESTDPTTRRTAFYGLLQLGFAAGMESLDYPVPAELLGLLNKYPAQADQIKVALIALLSREVSYGQSLPPDVTLSEDYYDYEGDVVAAVSSLNDVRSANALLAVINTGGMATDGLAAFGASVLDPVIERLSSPDATLRLSAAIVLAGLQVSDAASKDKLYRALIRAAQDIDPHVRATGIEGLNRLAPGAAVLVSEATSNRAIALDSVTWLSEPFRLDSPVQWGPDKRTRIMLFALNFSLLAGENLSVVTADAEDSTHRTYPLTVEYVGPTPGFDWLGCVIVRLNDDMGDVGDVLVRLNVRGVSSNRVRIGIGHIGGGPPDDLRAIPTAGREPQ